MFLPFCRPSSFHQQSNGGLKEPFTRHTALTQPHGESAPVAAKEEILTSLLKTASQLARRCHSLFLLLPRHNRPFTEAERCLFVPPWPGAAQPREEQESGGQTACWSFSEPPPTGGSVLPNPGWQITESFTCSSHPLLNPKSSQALSGEREVQTLRCPRPPVRKESRGRCPSPSHAGAPARGRQLAALGPSPHSEPEKEKAHSGSLGSHMRTGSQSWQHRGW